MLLRTIAISLLLAAFSFAENLSLALPDSLENLVEKATAQTMALDYKAALSTAQSLKAKDEGAGCVIESIVRISMYDFSWREKAWKNARPRACGKGSRCSSLALCKARQGIPSRAP